MKSMAALVVACSAVSAVAVTVSITEWATRPTPGVHCTVTDGDSLRCGNDRVRLRGIDAPEIGQPHGAAAATVLRALAARPLRCASSYRDRYGRAVARCINSDGVDIGREMVLRGLAVVAVHEDYRSDEILAQREARGVWADPTFIKPSEWRKRK